MGRTLIAVGIVIALVGAVIEFAPGFRLGRLPGDFSFGSANVRVFLPLGTSILLSILLTIIVALINRR